MAESLLSKIVKTDKKTFKTIESIDKRMSVLVTAQQKQIRYKKEQQSIDKKILQEEKRKKADSSLADKVKNVLGGDKEKTKGWFTSFLEQIGDVIKAIAPIAILGAIGIGLIGTAIYKFFTDEKFRSTLMDTIINPFITNVMNGITDIANGVTSIITGNEAANPVEGAKSLFDDWATQVMEGVDRKNSEKALTTFKERLEKAIPEEIGITSEEKEEKLKRINKVLKLMRKNSHAINDLKRFYELRKRGPSWFESKEDFEERMDKEIAKRAEMVEKYNEKLLNMQDKILRNTQIDISPDIIDPITGTPVKPVQKQEGGLVDRKKDKTDPRYKLGKMEMRGFESESQDEKNDTFIKRQRGGLVLFAGHNDVPDGHAQPGTDAPGTDLQGKYKPTAEQHFADEVARETQALAKKENVPISYQPSTGRYESGSHPDSNWSKMGRIRSSGGSAIELHFDAYGYEGGKLIQGTRGMIINGYNLSENEKKVQKAFGTHPSGDSFGGLILELDTINKAPGNSKSYARMIVDAMEGVTGPAPEIEAGSNRGDAASKVSVVQPPPQKNVFEMIKSGFGVAGQVIGAVYEAFMEVFGKDLGALFDFGGGGSKPTTTPSPGGGASGAGAVSINDPNGRAILNTIAWAEGTDKYPNNGYNTHFAGDQTSDLSRHPNIVKHGNGYSSAAFGRYQFMPATWAGVMGGEMSPARQDEAALKLVARRGVNLSDGLSLNEVKKLANEWASILGNDYGQGYKTPQAFLDQYEKLGGKVEGKQQGGIVGSHGSQDSMMMTMSEDQFFDRLQEQFEVIDVQYPVTPAVESPHNSGGDLDFGTLANGEFDEAMRFAAGSAYS